MKGLGRLCREQKAGTTLVEMVVTLLIFGIMMAMAVGILSPAAKIFLRMQKLQYARLILDNTVQELRGMARGATQYVKIYAVSGADDPGSLLTDTGAESGKALEFLDTDGYVVLISADGCPDTDIYLGTEKVGDVKSADVERGRLLERYFVRGEGAAYNYKKNDGTYIARAYNKTFADRYYMGNYLDIVFTYGAFDSEGNVKNLKADVTLYSDEEKTQVAAKDSVVLELRYDVKKKDEVTAGVVAEEEP